MLWSLAPVRHFCNRPYNVVDCAIDTLADLSWPARAPAPR
jgi:hypothetical protein